MNNGAVLIVTFGVMKEAISERVVDIPRFVYPTALVSLEPKVTVGAARFV